MNATLPNGYVVAGRWTIERLCGLGGSATVYAARHRNGRRAALKILRPELASNPLVRRRFLREGYAANKVQHPGAVSVLDDGEDGDLVFLVMELLNGRSLADRVASEGTLSAAELARVSAGVLDVLAHAHDRGVVHRDIKPSNLFELENGTIKVLDFGVAHVRDAELSSVTQSGAALGTPAFMAPEQAAGRLDEVDAMSDIWAVGASAFYLATGRLPHDAATPNAAIVAAATRRVLPVRELRRDLPSDLALVIDRALAFRREERWPNAKAMRAALASTAPELEAAQSLSSITIPEGIVVTRETRRPLLPALTLALLAALVVVSLRLHQQHPAAIVAVSASKPAELRALPAVAASVESAPAAVIEPAPRPAVAQHAGPRPLRPRAAQRAAEQPASDPDLTLIETRQ